MLRKQTPSDEDTKSALLTVLPPGAQLVTMDYAFFPSGKYEGRVSYSGTIEFATDHYSKAREPSALIQQLLLDHGISEPEVAQWYSENRNAFPELSGRLAEYTVTLTAGDDLPFTAEAKYSSTVDGVRVDDLSLIIEGADRLGDNPGGYEIGSELQSKIEAAVVAWSNRHRQIEAEREAARVAAELEQARIAEEQERERNKATPTNAKLGDLDPIVVAPNETSVEVVNQPHTTICWASGLPKSVIREAMLPDGTWVVLDASVEFVNAYRWKNTGSEPITVYARRKEGTGC